MKKQIFKSGDIAVLTLAAGAILGTLALFSIYLSPSATYSLLIKSEKTAVTVGEPVTMTIEAQTETPANVFSGIVHFDPTLFTVERISYNTSIANLWTEEPWYNNGDGTISFAGGTTQPGGFSGTGTLITITFIPQAVGKQTVSVTEARILLHDGFGTDTFVETPDAIFTITRVTTPAEIIPPTTIVIIPSKERLDLTGNGKISIADLSAFFSLYYKNDLRADFNNDGVVNLADASILMNAVRSN